MLSPKMGRRNQQQPIVNDPYNSNLNLNQSNTYRQQHYNRYNTANEPQISVSQSNLNQRNDSQGFLASLGTLGRKKRQQEGEFAII